jgi:hypothetical protein
MTGWVGSAPGQGSNSVKLPVLEEAWYVSMYWNSRPPGGTRVLVYDPATGDAVVASGGYETGPGLNESIGGRRRGRSIWRSGHITTIAWHGVLGGQSTSARAHRL